MTERSDVELMLAFREGDESAFGSLVERHRQSVMNLTYRYLGNRTDAEDLSQEVFLKVYRARNRYRPDAKFSTWLYRIAVNACLNEVRNRKNRLHFRAASLSAPDDDSRPGLAPAAEGDSPVAAAELEELREEVRRAVDALPERQRIALLLNKFQGMSYEDLAATLELSIQAVKSLLTRARANVREQIEPFLRKGERPAPGAHSLRALPGRGATS